MSTTKPESGQKPKLSTKISRTTDRSRRSARPQKSSVKTHVSHVDESPPTTNKTDKTEDTPANPNHVSLHLTTLKRKSANELIEIANSYGLESVARLRKQDMIFAILKGAAKRGEDIYGDGVLEILQDGFGFLRSAEASYLSGPDDIYVSPSQIRRFNLRTGDSVTGKIRPPKEGERYFALLKVGEINFDAPENAKNKVLFENLTPLFAQDRLIMETGTST